MPDAPRISDAEWQVMKVLWERSPLTAPEIIAALEPETDWSPKTVHTLISRLVQKGALAQTKDARLYSYRPLVSQRECRLAETRTFVEKVYDGSIGLLVANLVRNDRLTPEEIEELKRLLERHE